MEEGEGKGGGKGVWSWRFADMSWIETGGEVGWGAW